MFDQTEQLHNSWVQYGPYNDRVYLMKLDSTDLPELVDELADLCQQHGFSKVFAKIPAAHSGPFEAAGYREEARVPGMYAGDDDALFLSRYLDDKRAIEEDPARVREVLKIARVKGASDIATAATVPIEETTPDDAPEMAEVYRRVFASYPFPIHDPSYLAETMATHIRYFCVRERGRIIALSSAEMDVGAACVEMTDFATLPQARGQGLALHLLAAMEAAMLVQGNMRTAYTIARALSAGMNVTFARAGYTFAGTLTNNTNISGHIESMNVWYKGLGG